MAGNRTFTMIKPDAVADGNSGAIIKMIEEAGFRIVAMKMTKLSDERAGQFYEVHKERPFYGELKAYMSKGHIVPMILEKSNAVADFRKLIGATNPANAEDAVKISFRSKGNFSVNEFARKHFEGGGHKNASGGKSDLTLEETIKKFENIIPQYKEELSRNLKSEKSTC